MPTGTLKRLVKTPISMPTLEEHTLRFLKLQPLGTRFVDFSTFGANARKSSNRTSWGWFSRLLEPRPESRQIEPPGTLFVDCLIRGWKVIKSSFLGFVLSTSGANARKSSNRFSWDWFSRLLDPPPPTHPLALLQKPTKLVPRTSI